MNRRFTSVAALVALATLLAALPAGGASGAASSTVFTYASQNSIVTDFDPATSYSNESIAHEQHLRAAHALRLAKPRRSSRCSPRRGRSSARGKTWTFTLRKRRRSSTPAARSTAQAAKAAIQRTIKLKGGAAYIWDAVKSIATPSPQTLVFHLKYPAPLDIISSSGYAAYIYDTKAAGSADLVKWFGGAHDAGTGPYMISNVEEGPAGRAAAECVQGLLGRLVGQRTTRARCSSSCRSRPRSRSFCSRAR